jgi:CRP/FNR family transcriptional regulator
VRNAQKERAVPVLSQCEFFKDFQERDLDALAQYLDVRTGDRGDVLYVEGEPSDALYVIGEGRVELLMNDHSGQPRLIGWLGPTETFGELSLVTKGERRLTVRAGNDVVLYELGSASFERLRAEKPHTCLLIIMALVKRLSSVVDDNGDLLRRVLLQELSKV